MKNAYVSENPADYLQRFWRAIYPRAISAAEVEKIHASARMTHAEATALHLEVQQGLIETRKLISELNGLLDEDVEGYCSTMTRKYGA